MKGKNIVLGVTGGIAAYKAADLCSRLIKAGAHVDVMMTRHATEFIQPLTFQTLTGNPVVVEQFETPVHWELAHISLSQKADLFAIVPATANMIGKMANGIADDFISTSYLATTAPVLVAPAMNTKMYDHPAVQANLDRLESHGVMVLNTAEGRLACGDIGKGKLPPVENIFAHMERALHPQDLAGVRLIVTAGPTTAPIDPVRILTNRSTGKMGFEIARAAFMRGAQVDLIAHHCPEELQQIVSWTPINTTEDMYKSVSSALLHADGLVMSAAPLDYEPLSIAKEKIKKNDQGLHIDFKRTVDILKNRPKLDNKIVIGFAAESQNLIANALKKCHEKNLDMVVANDISRSDIGFASEQNQATFVYPDRQESLPLMSKASLAHEIVNRFLQMREDA
jgi:phosphopantothenoylcysteine decarboxylase/phosphopantothenate--cysteine ligase